MVTIKIDSDVFAFLEKHAKPFVDTPNSTLRRLLGIDRDITSVKPRSLTRTLEEELDGLRAKSKVLTHNRSKAPKTNLESLARAGLIRNGEKLYLIDYKGNRVQKVQAVVSGNHLIYNGRPYSMTGIAKGELAKLGFRSKDVRGPAHWVTVRGKSVKDLWQQYLDKNAKE